MYYGISTAFANNPDEALEQHTDQKVSAALLSTLSPTVYRVPGGYECELALRGYWGWASAITLEGAIALAFEDLIADRCSVGTQRWLNRNGSPSLQRLHDETWELRGAR